MKEVPTFHAWFESPANPIGRASHAAQYFTRDALKVAFEAGEAYAKDQQRRDRRGDDIENPFL